MILCNRKRHNILLYVCALLYALMLSGCTDQKCIDADNFGYPQFVIPSYYSKDQLVGDANLQIAPWIDSGYKLNGYPITILVKNWKRATDYNNPASVSAWCPWYADDSGPGVLSKVCANLQECQFRTATAKEINANNNSSLKGIAPIGNIPCLMKKGIGLYAAIPGAGVDPNASALLKEVPPGINFHVGRQKDYQMYDIDKYGNSIVAGGIVYDMAAEGHNPISYTGSSLYFKIVDKFYDSHNGQYRIVIKSGVDYLSGDPIMFVTDLVKSYLFGKEDNSAYPGLVPLIYKNIVNASSFKIIVRALMTLFVVITAISFLMGTLKMTHTEFIVRVVKLSLVSVLLTSQESWSFFKDYFYVYFLDGVKFIIAQVQAAGGAPPGSMSVLSLIFAQETVAKLISLLFATPLGFIYILLYLLVLYIVLMTLFHATVIYLTSFILISLLIMLGPFFICCILFKFTKQLFDSWLRQLVKYSLQPIILFTGLAFITSMMEHEIHSSLGFKVCKRDIFSMPNLSFADPGEQPGEQSLLSWWWPAAYIGYIDKKSGFIETNVEAVIPVPETYTKSDGTVCLPYQCFEKRDLNFPFLDLEKDRYKLLQFRAGNFADPTGLLIILVMIYFITRFNKSVESIANYLAGAVGTSVSLQAAGSAVAKGGIEGVNKMLTGRVQYSTPPRPQRESSSDLVSAKGQDKGSGDSISSKGQAVKDGMSKSK